MPFRAQWREELLCLSLLLCVILCHCDQINGSHLYQEASPSIGQLTATAGEHGRRLLQNPDRPALSTLWGVDMSTMLASGYPLENHKAVTSDGWVLNLYRIPHGKNRNTSPGKRPVIYLHHGISLSSACFTLLNENESMAYILADAGFDVWMPNTRGNTFSTGNFYFSSRQVEYWQHSVDEYALLDSPAMVDKVLEVTGASKVAWVGHSQGGTIGYSLLSAKPEYNDKITVMIGMGPVWMTQFLGVPFLSAMSKVNNGNFAAQASVGEFLMQRTLAPFVPQCRDNYLAEGCVSALSVLFAGPSTFISPDDYPVIGQTWPAGVSTRNLMHYSQTAMANRLEFRAFDHGTNCSNIGFVPFHETCNQMKYGSMDPPTYDLGKVTVPVVVLEAEMDIMSTADDITAQRRRLVNTSPVSIVYQTYGHMDFVWDRSARHMLDVVEIAFRYSPGTF